MRPISLFGRSDYLFIKYQNGEKRTDAKLNLSNKKNHKAPIKIDYYNDTNELKFIVRPFSDYELESSDLYVKRGGVGRVDLSDKEEMIVHFIDKSRINHTKLHIYWKDIDSPENSDIDSPYNYPQDSDTNRNKDGDSENRIIKILEETDGVEYINDGGYRNVYYDKENTVRATHTKIDGNIIKVGRHAGGVTANRKEVQTWQAVKGSEIEKYFCPITNIGPDHRYIVMKFAGSEVTTIDSNRLDTILSKSIYNHTNEQVTHGLDISSSNIGIFDGRPVMIDYPYGGNFEIQSPDVGRLEYYANRVLRIIN